MRTYDGNGKSGSITLHGQAEPFFDGGNGKVLNAQVKRKKGCDCPQDEPCMTGSGTLKVTYKVDVTITMPDVPGGLTACQERRVRDFLRNVLGPHEQDHARRLRSYDGTTRRAFTVTACGRSALDEAVNSKIQQMQTDEHDQRSADAEKKSAAIDPFNKADRPQLQVGLPGRLPQEAAQRCPRLRPLGRSAASRVGSTLATSDR